MTVQRISGFLRPKRNIKAKTSAFDVINVIVILLVCAVTVYPFLNVLAKSVNDGNDTAMGGITLYPRDPTLYNFELLFANDSIIRAFGITVARVAAGTLLGLIIQYSAAYAFTKKHFKGRSALLLFLIVPMYISGGLIPMYILYSRIHFLNNFLVYIVPGAFSFYNMILIRTYLYTIPKSVEESATLDGASDFTILCRILVPLSLPIMATITLWMAVGHWNDWTTTLYFIIKPKLFTLQYILMQIIRESERIASMIEVAMRKGGNLQAAANVKATPESVRCAQIMVTTLPIVLVYPFLQKYFIKGVMIGAVKD